jgi:hypothetical protein
MKQSADVMACRVAWRTPLKFQCIPQSTLFQYCLVGMLLNSAVSTTEVAYHYVTLYNHSKQGKNIHLIKLWDHTHKVKQETWSPYNLNWQLICCVKTSFISKILTQLTGTLTRKEILSCFVYNNNSVKECRWSSSIHMSGCMHGPAASLMIPIGQEIGRVIQSQSDCCEKEAVAI